ncbi:MAG: CRISPR-associated helicase Cas3' [Desulfobacteraceae bacterium]|nr:CRISPR-associated helicase Cas3' [Desulfobacteraceae bacterium]MBU4035715.1 CRISPR-associated helicase Cas3' [Pseudomonadota bacterium]
MMLFWAKTTREGKPGISVYDHMVNVGCVAQCIAENSPYLLKRFHLNSGIIGALSALHDLGKISPGFQQKCEAWLGENNLVTVARNNVWDTTMETDHGKVTHSATQAFLLENGMDRKTAKFVSTILGAHHGRLNPPNDRGYQPNKATSESQSKVDWHSERMTQARKAWEHFLNKTVSFSISEESPALWWLAGLTSISDWIGSDERFFPSDSSVTAGNPREAAFQAVESIGLGKNSYVKDLSFHDLFHDTENPDENWVPSDIQEKAYAMINGPGVYIIEAPMGTGKTEAAFWAAYNLLIAGKATGIYFALPTQATSNRMHLRMNDFIGRICPQSTGSRLIHGNSWLMAHCLEILPSATKKCDETFDDARAGRDWFSSPKRSLIASFGVGTIDQALLGIVAAKHFFIRHFALAGKVVILDEIHSYDLYTGTLIDKLISTLEGLGCTVIVLSATLTGTRRNQILANPQDFGKEDSSSYPLLTGRSEGQSLPPVSPTPPESKRIKVEFVSRHDAGREAITVSRKGGSVLWVCNTVEAAQIQYQHLRDQIGNEFPMGLLHSRFPYWRREQLEVKWMERLGKLGKTRCPCILVATQVVEQSVDLDADLLITELAPTDMMLQRLGRLWRHNRPSRPINEARICIIGEEKEVEELKGLSSEQIKKELGSKALVYAPYILLRSLELWKQQSSDYGEITIPSQIRPMIESTYSQRENDPDAWKQLSDEWFGTDSAKKMLASRNCNLWQVALEDEEGVQTRINEIPNDPLILCRAFSDKEACFLDNSMGRWDNDEYRLPTARAIHKNMVKIPDYCFTRMDTFPFLSDYLGSKHVVGLVNEVGDVKIKGSLNRKYRLSYSAELGLVIHNEKSKEDI